MENLLKALQKTNDNICNDNYKRLSEKMSKFLGLPEETIMPVLKEVMDKKAEERVNQLLKDKTPLELMEDLLSGKNMDTFKMDVAEIIQATQEILSKLNVVQCDADDVITPHVIKSIADLDIKKELSDCDTTEKDEEEFIEEEEEEEVIVKTVYIDTAFLKETIDSGKKVQVVLEFV